MASRRNLRRKACTGKRRYETEAEAGAVTVRLAARDPARGRPWPYRCAFCSGLHVGRPPTRVRQAAAAKAATGVRAILRAR